MPVIQYSHDRDGNVPCENASVSGPTLEYYMREVRGPEATLPGPPAVY
jgi:hypothetical protein